MKSNTSKTSQPKPAPATTAPPAPEPPKPAAPVQTPTSAPSVTIAPRNPAKGVVLYVVTLLRFGREPASYPCRSLDRAMELAQTFIGETTKAATAG
jgi:hypothetical protein